MSLKEAGLNKLREFGANEGEVSLVSDLFDALPPSGGKALNDLILFSRDLPGETPRRRVSKVTRLAAFLAPHSKEFKANVLEFLSSPTTRMNLFHARKHNLDLSRENALDVVLQSLRILSRTYNEDNPIKDSSAGAAMDDLEVVFAAFLENRRRTVERATDFLDLTSKDVARDLNFILRGLAVIGLTRLSEAAKKYKSPKEIVLSAAREELGSLERRTSLEGKFSADREDRIAAVRSLVFELSERETSGRVD